MTLAQMMAVFNSEERNNITPPLWESTDIKRWFNEAEQEAAVRGNLIFDTDSATLAADTTAVSLDAGIYEVERVFLSVSGGTPFEVTPTDRREQDRLSSNWRTTTGRPTQFIHDDTRLVFNRIADAAYTVSIEGFRLPASDMAADADTPEIARIHHSKLIEWVRYRAYSIPDNDNTRDAKKAEIALGLFEDYFGPRPQANESRARNANRPHRVKAWI